MQKLVAGELTFKKSPLFTPTPYHPAPVPHSVNYKRVIKTLTIKISNMRNERINLF
jgi:hypothetical protein